MRERGGHLEGLHHLAPHPSGSESVKIESIANAQVAREAVVLVRTAPGRDAIVQGTLRLRTRVFATGNIWFDFVGPRPGTLRRVTPYLVAGGGVMRHTDEFLNDFIVNEWAFTGGVGVRIALNERWYIAPEARLGWEPHSRLSANVGYRFP